MVSVSDPAPEAPEALEAEPRAPQNHRTIDRVTRIVEEVVYTPGMTFAELSRALDAPKSSVHGFIRGLIAAGWLHQDDNRFYLGPALQALTLVSGQMRPGSVTEQDLRALHADVDAPVFLGVRAGDDLLYIAEAGAERLPTFGASSNIRRDLLGSAGGKALLAATPLRERDAYLRRRRDRPDLIDAFQAEFDDIVKTRIARNYLQGGSRFALATVVRDRNGRGVAEVTIVGPTALLESRAEELEKALLHHADLWESRSR